MKLTGLKDVDVKIIIDCIANEIIDLTIVKNKDVRFGSLGIFCSEYISKSKYDKKPRSPKKNVIGKRITLKNSKHIKKLCEEMLERDKKAYESRIIW